MDHAFSDILQLLRWAISLKRSCRSISALLGCSCVPYLSFRSFGQFLLFPAWATANLRLHIGSLSISFVIHETCKTDPATPTYQISDIILFTSH